MKCVIQTIPKLTIYFSTAMKTILFRVFGAVVALSTVCVFFLFAYRHPEVIENLKQTTAKTILTIVVMYAGSIFSIVLILSASLRLYGKYLPYSEYILLTAYSSFANFFGPGQSGPGVRAVYLKIKHGLNFKYFLFSTLTYLAWLAFLSGAMLFAARLPWWLTSIFILVAAGACVLLIWFAAGQNKTEFVPEECKPRLIRMVLTTGIGAALQISFITAAYFVELCSVDSSVTLSQAISFTGAANFSLFVSITPGAIGIREILLFLFQDMHGVSVETIATASALDRAVYMVVLALLGLLILFTHASYRFRQPGEAKSPGDP